MKSLYNNPYLVWSSLFLKTCWKKHCSTQRCYLFNPCLLDYLLKIVNKNLTEKFTVHLKISQVVAIFVQRWTCRPQYVLATSLSFDFFGEIGFAYHDSLHSWLGVTFILLYIFAHTIWAKTRHKYVRPLIHFKQRIWIQQKHAWRMASS